MNIQKEKIESRSISLPKIAIRHIRNDDIKAILKIALECQLEKWTELDYQTEITRNDSLIIVAEVDKKIVGFISTRFSDITVKNDSITGKPETECFRDADILNIGVIKKYRNLGIGGILFNKLCKFAMLKQVKTIWLEVRESNITAISFYEKEGFSKIQIRKNFYADPTDNAVLMKCDIFNSGKPRRA